MQKDKQFLRQISMKFTNYSSWQWMQSRSLHHYDRFYSKLHPPYQWSKSILHRNLPEARNEKYPIASCTYSSGYNLSDAIVDDFKKRILKANTLTVKFDNKQVEYKFDNKINPSRSERTREQNSRIRVRDLKQYIAPRFGIMNPDKIYLTRSYDYLQSISQGKEEEEEEALGESLVLDDEDILEEKDAQFPINMHLAVDMDVYYSFSGEYIGRITFFLHELFSQKEISDVLKMEHNIEHQDLRYYFHPYIGFWFWEYFGTSLNRYKVIACANRDEPLTLIVGKRRKKARNLNYYLRFCFFVWILYSYVL